MTENSKWLDRDNEMLSFFYLIYRNRVHSGLPPKDAKKDAYDAVYLRYGVGTRRLRNIMSMRKSFHDVNRFAFTASALAMISDLKDANKELAVSMDKNNKLISLLEECVQDDI